MPAIITLDEVRNLLQIPTGDKINIVNKDRLEKKKYCKCGCGKEIIIKPIHKHNGIPDYISGHNCKGKNNPMYGKPGWNKDLTKDTDPRVRKSGENISKTHKERGVSKGKNNPMFGVHLSRSVETKIKQGKTLKEGIASGRTKPGMLGKTAWNKGLTKETDPRVMQYCKNIKGRHRTKEANKKQSKTMKEGFAFGRIVWNKGKTKEECPQLACSKENKKRMKKRWQDTEYRERTIKNILKGTMKRPTSFEDVLLKIIKKYNLPYKYVGDGSFLIGYKNPDFININGDKVCIEVYNDYHHPSNYEEIRSKHFAKYGWKTRFVSEDNIDNEDYIFKTLNADF